MRECDLVFESRWSTLFPRLIQSPFPSPFPIRFHVQSVPFFSLNESSYSRASLCHCTHNWLSFSLLNESLHSSFHFRTFPCYYLEPLSLPCSTPSNESIFIQTCYPNHSIIACSLRDQRSIFLSQMGLFLPLTVSLLFISSSLSNPIPLDRAAPWPPEDRGILEQNAPGQYTTRRRRLLNGASDSTPHLLQRRRSSPSRTSWPATTVEVREMGLR